MEAQVPQKVPKVLSCIVSASPQLHQCLSPVPRSPLHPYACIQARVYAHACSRTHTPLYKHYRRPFDSTTQSQSGSSIPPSCFLLTSPFRGTHTASSSLLLLPPQLPFRLHIHLRSICDIATLPHSPLNSRSSQPRPPSFSSPALLLLLTSRSSPCHLICSKPLSSSCPCP